MAGPGDFVDGLGCVCVCVTQIHWVLVKVSPIVAKTVITTATDWIVEEGCICLHVLIACITEV